MVVGGGSGRNEAVDVASQQHTGSLWGDLGRETTNVCLKKNSFNYSFHMLTLLDFEMELDVNSQLRLLHFLNYFMHSYYQKPKFMRGKLSNVRKVFFFYTSPISYRNNI